MDETKEKKRQYEEQAEALATDIFAVASTMFGEKAIREMAADKIEAAMDKLGAEVAEAQYQTGYEDGLSDSKN